MATDAPGQEATQRTLTPRAENDGVVTALCHNALDQVRRVAVGLDEFRLDAVFAEPRLGFLTVASRARWAASVPSYAKRMRFMSGTSVSIHRRSRRSERHPKDEPGPGR